ncbi:MAG: hypothetical protein U1A27_08830 [Phycisphaerae bacterium]
MNPRDKIIVSAIGSLIGLWVLWQAGTGLYVSPLAELKSRVDDEQKKVASLARERRDLAALADEWKTFARRTYSTDVRDTQNRFLDDLKELATRHKLSGVSFTPLSAGKLPRSDVRTVAVRMVGEGQLTDVAALLGDLYRLSALVSVRKLRLAPVTQVGGSDVLRVTELLVETLVLPTISEAVEPVRAALRRTTTMPSDPAFAPTPLWVDLPSAADYALVSRRNVFKAYEPPPAMAVEIDNQDLKAVQVKVRFHWKSETSEQPALSVEGKSKRELAPGAGDRAEVTVTYADGKTFGPQTLPAVAGKPATLVVPSHTPPPPPSRFAVRVRNDSPETVDVEAILTRGNAPKPLPTMRVASKATVELPEMEGERLALVGVYGDGSKSTPVTYSVATDSTATYVVPAKNAAPQVVQQPAKPLPPPDPDQMVSGLLRYPSAHELIAWNAKTRKRQIMALGDAIDGGTLVMVDPVGGVVRMPGEMFFLYPLGKKFAERVALEARDESDLPIAIARWNEQ